MENGNNVFQIRPAVRKAIPALIGLWGPSNSGKTYSALLMARGLVGPQGKIGMVDTENERAQLYAELAGGWDHLDLQPPFSPERYTQAFREFEDGGYGCVIVDSTSHVWEGEGGVLDMADNAKTKDGKALEGLGKWKKPKIAYKRMVNALLRAPFHVIFCLRAKEAYAQTGRGPSGKIEYLGAEPICGKGFIYEMTVSIFLGPDHKPVHQNTEAVRCSPMIPSVKAPGDLWGTIKPGEFLSEANGAAIASYLGSGAPVDHDANKVVRKARDVATFGMARLEEHWNTLSKPDQRALKPHMAEIKAIAAEADREAEEAPEPFGTDTASSDNSDPLSDRFTDTEEKGAA